MELIIPILTYETGGVGRKRGRGCWWWRTVAVNSRLINYTSACGNILPKCQSGPCEAAHLTTLAQHVQRSTWWKTHTQQKKKGFKLHQTETFSKGQRNDSKNVCTLK